MKNDDYYIYVYLNQTKVGGWTYKTNEFTYQPFYVGKGRKNRINMHLCPSLMKSKSIKNSIIKSIFSKVGESPIHYKIYENLSDDEAILIEKDFIKQFGRIDNGTGILGNGTDGGEGSNNFSPETLKKVGAKVKKLYQYTLDGDFIKEWDSVSSTVDEFKNIGNISTAIKRSGSSYGYLWSYTFKDKLTPKTKYEMPNKYINIKQYDKYSDELIKIFDDALQIEKELSLRTGARNKIYECLTNKIKIAYGYKWKI